MPFNPDPELGAFIRGLPKAEHHLHIEGALPFELLHGLDPQRFAQPPESWEPGFRFHDFAHFEHELLSLAGAWFTSPERYHAAASLIFTRLQAEQGAVRVATSFASGVIEYLGLDGQQVAAAIAAAAPPGLEVRVFMGIHHNGYTPRSAPFIEASLGWPELAGYDLHGTETFPVEPWTADFWSRARSAGKETKAHAGEFCGPDFVWWVLDNLEVSRIQHGVRAIEDPHLVRRLAADGVVLDVCPISNLKLGVVPSLQQHPLRRLVDGGVVCTLNTDDPMSFGNHLAQEYAVAYRYMGFTRDELAALAANSLR
jgi:adenine deaminase